MSFRRGRRWRQTWRLALHLRRNQPNMRPRLQMSERPPATRARPFPMPVADLRRHLCLRRRLQMPVPRIRLRRSGRLSALRQIRPQILC